MIPSIFSRLFYAGAVEGQMPEILSMIQVDKMTPAPAVLIVVSISYIFLEHIYDDIELQLTFYSINI